MDNIYIYIYKWTSEYEWNIFEKNNSMPFLYFLSIYFTIRIKLKFHFQLKWNLNLKRNRVEEFILLENININNREKYIIIIIFLSIYT